MKVRVGIKGTLFHCLELISCQVEDFEGRKLLQGIFTYVNDPIPRQTKSVKARINEDPSLVHKISITTCSTRLIILKKFRAMGKLKEF